VSTVVGEAEGKGASEFLKQIRLDSSSGDVEIATDSGTLDFSEPATPMLPWLLKNAKTSKDGSFYKVIPIGKSEGKPGKTIKDTSKGLKAMRETTSMQGIAEGIASSFNAGSPLVVTKSEPPSSSGSHEFRTVSSKQDPSTSWVLPPKDRDMSSIVHEINARLRADIHTSVESILSKYLKEAEDVVRNG
jgi:hypothetical protein